MLAHVSSQQTILDGTASCLLTTWACNLVGRELLSTNQACRCNQHTVLASKAGRWIFSTTRLVGRANQSAKDPQYTSTCATSYVVGVLASWSHVMGNQVTGMRLRYQTLRNNPPVQAPNKKIDCNGNEMNNKIVTIYVGKMFLWCVPRKPSKELKKTALHIFIWRSTPLKLIYIVYNSNTLKFEVNPKLFAHWFRMRKVLLLSNSLNFRKFDTLAKSLEFTWIFLCWSFRICI